MTTETVNAGWLLLGLSLLVLGGGIVWAVAHESFSKRANAKADEYLAETPAAVRSRVAFIHHGDETQAQWERHVADALAYTERLSVVPSNVVEFPAQRDPSRWS